MGPSLPISLSFLSLLFFLFYFILFLFWDYFLADTFYRIVQFSLPALLVIIMIQYVGTENTAATWSVVNRMISNTIWPILLQSDTVGAINRSRTTVTATWVMTLSALLLVVTSVVAPLGLREEVIPHATRPVMFQYVKDTGAWGRVTMDRPNLEMSRYCESGRSLNCPGQFQGVTMQEIPPGSGNLTSVRENNETSIINTTLPLNFTKMFTSATDGEGNTLSGLLDIHPRRWKLTRFGLVDFGRPRAVPEKVSAENLMAFEDIYVREGVVVDMRDTPAVGFRNHTIPVGLGYGGTWREDLTFLEPVTSCVDTNISIELERADTVDSFTDKQTTWFIDRGAFRDLSIRDLEAPPWNDNQTLNLQGRAFKAARMYNVLVAALLNITLPLGPNNQTLPKINLTASSEFRGAVVSFLDAESIFIDDLVAPVSLRLTSNISTTGNIVRVPANLAPAYPDGIRRMFAQNFTAISNICHGFYSLESRLDLRASNITNPAVRCGLFIGGGEWNQVSEDETQTVYKMDKRLFVCASAIRASIKTVDFLYNGTTPTPRLQDLRVTGLADKVWSENNTSEKPLWAVETSEPRRSVFDPLWGLVSQAYENFPGFYTTRADKLWLPFGDSLIVNFGRQYGRDVIVAASGPMLALDGAYRREGIIEEKGYYSGEIYYALRQRWARLSQSVETVSRIPSLMLNDDLATRFTGSKTAIRDKPTAWPPKMAVEDPAERLSRAEVEVYEKVIRYDIRYAIPAFITLFIFAVVILWSGAILVTSWTVLRTLKRQYNQISTGRLVTNLMYPGRSDPNEPSVSWARGDGALLLKFGRVEEPMQDYFCLVQARQDGYQWPGEKGDSTPGEGHP